MTRLHQVNAYSADDRALLAAGNGGLVLTARAGANPAGIDVVSRCFFPGSGISEDPVTGAAHCALAPYWAPHSAAKSSPATSRPRAAAPCACA